MKIAIFTNNYLPNPYGVSTSVEGFRKSLTEKGHTVYVFAPSWSGEDFDDSPNVFRYPAFKAPTKIDFSLVVPYSSSIDEKIEKLDFDIIHAQHPNLLGATAKRYARRKDVPIVFTWHSLYDRYAHYLPFVPEKISAHLALRNAADFANDCDHVIIPTDSVIDEIKGAGLEHDDISVVSSGVDEELFANPERTKFRERFGYDDNQIVLVTISRLTEEKNVIFLAEQISTVLKKNAHVQFLCVGEGDQKDNMEEIFRAAGVLSQVQFPGKAKREEVKDCLAVGDIFVYASTSETQGTIITECMYSGRPLVAVYSHGVKSLLIDHGTGIASEESDQFSKHVQELIDSPELRRQYGDNAKKIAKDQYTIDVCSDRLLKVYNEVISKKR